MIEWITTNWEGLIAAIGAFIVFVGLVAKLTPSPKDDKIVAKILSWFKLIPTKK